MSTVTNIILTALALNAHSDIMLTKKRNFVLRLAISVKHGVKKMATVKVAIPAMVHL